MQHISQIPLSEPVTVQIPAGRYGLAEQEITMDSIEVWYVINATARKIWAQIAKIPHPVLLYRVEDFAAAALDLPEQLNARLMEILGDDVQTSLSSIATGNDQPIPSPLIPREIANWRARAVLEIAGLLASVDSLIAGMTGPSGIVVRQAWQSGAPLARAGATVTALAAQLGLSSSQIDDLFIQAASLEV